MELNYNQKYYQAHKQYWLDYQIKNKEKIDAYNRIKYTCDTCGGRYTTKHLAQHQNTNKHKKSLES